MSNIVKARWLRDKIDDLLSRYDIVDVDDPFIDVMCVDVIKKLDENAEMLREALKGVRNEIIYGGGEFEEPDIDKIFDFVDKALKGKNESVREALL